MGALDGILHRLGFECLRDIGVVNVVVLKYVKMRSIYEYFHAMLCSIMLFIKEHLI